MALPKQGERVRERTPQEQAFFEQMMPRLAAGESPVKLARQFGMNAATLRSWVSRERKRAHKRKVEEGEALPAVAVEVADVVPRVAEVAEVEVGSQQRFMVEQSQVANEWLVSMRGPRVSMALGGVQDCLEETLKKILEVTRRGKKLIQANYQGEIVTEEVDMGLGDYGSGAAAIKGLLEVIAKLHCLPLQAQDPKAFHEKRQPAFQPHLHLHSHGGKDKEPVAEASPSPTLRAITEPMRSSIVPDLDDVLSQYEVDDLA